MICELPFCEGKRYAKSPGLCPTHNKHKREGKPLEPLSPMGVAGGRNAKYKGVTCSFEGCDKQAVSNSKCGSHDWQQRRYGYQWPLGTPRPGTEGKVSMEDRSSSYGPAFSTDRWCPKCKETKHWTKYHQDMNMCRACYRDVLAKAARGPQEARRSTKAKQRMEDLLAFLEARTSEDA